MAARCLLLVACFVFITFQGRSQIDLQDPLGSAFRISVQSKLRSKLPANTCVVVFSGGFQAFDPESKFPQDFSCDADFHYLTGLSIPDAAAVVFSESHTLAEGEVSTLLFLPDKTDYGLASMGYEYRGKMGLQADGVCIRSTGQWKKFCTEVLNVATLERVYSKPIGFSDYRKPAERDFNYLGEKFYNILAPGFAFDPRAQRYYKDILVADTATMGALMTRIQAMIDYEAVELRDPILMRFLKARNDEALKKVQAEIKAVKLDLLQLRKWLDELRSVKSDREIEALRKTSAKVMDGLRYAAARTSAGKPEMKLVAVAEYLRQLRNCRSMVPPVAASGKHSAQPNYFANSDVLPNGGLVVLDLAWAYQGYAARVARTLPIGGTFQGESKALYDGVHAIHQKSIAGCVAKGTTGKIQEAASLGFEGVDKRLIFASNALGGRKVLKVTDVHGIGLDLEEPTPNVFAPNMVVVVETAIYFPDEDGITAKWRGNGIVLRDVVRITEGNPEVLTQSLPTESAALETLVKSTLPLPED